MQQFSFFGTTNEFLLFGQDHLLVIVLTMVLAILLPRFAKKQLNPEQQIKRIV